MGTVFVWFANLATTALGYFGARVATRTAFYVAGSIAVVAIFLAIASLCTAAFTTFQSTLTNTWLVNGVSLFLPWNTSLCISAYLSASFAKWMVRVGLIHVMIAARA